MLKKLHKYFKSITGRELPIGSLQNKKGEGMTELIMWIKTNWESVLAIIGGIVSVATIIVKLTPTQKDDNALATIIRILAIFSLVNPDGSFIGKKDK